MEFQQSKRDPPPFIYLLLPPPQLQEEGDSFPQGAAWISCVATQQRVATVASGSFLGTDPEKRSAPAWPKGFILPSGAAGLLGPKAASLSPLLKPNRATADPAEPPTAPAAQPGPFRFSRAPGRGRALGDLVVSRLRREKASHLIALLTQLNDDQHLPAGIQHRIASTKFTVIFYGVVYAPGAAVSEPSVSPSSPVSCCGGEGRKAALNLAAFGPRKGLTPASGHSVPRSSLLPLLP